MIDIMENKVIGPAIRKGMRQADTRTLAMMLTEKFGPLPDDTVGRIEEATHEQLQAWLKRVLTAKDLSSLFTE